MLYLEVQSNGDIPLGRQSSVEDFCAFLLKLRMICIPPAKDCITCWKVATPNLVVHLYPVSTMRNNCCALTNRSSKILKHAHVDGQKAHEVTNITSSSSIHVIQRDFVPTSSSDVRCMAGTSYRDTRNNAMKHRWKIGSN